MLGVKPQKPTADQPKPSKKKSAEKKPSMRHNRRVSLTKAIGVLWPLLCALTTISTLVLIRYISSAVHLEVKDALWWISGVLAVAGSVAAGLFSGRDHERLKAVVAFAAWAAIVVFFASGVYALVAQERR